MSRRKRSSFRRRSHKPYGLVERERTESERVVAAMVEINREIEERCEAANQEVWRRMEAALNQFAEGLARAAHAFDRLDDELAWTFANWGPDRPREVDVEVLDMTNAEPYRRPSHPLIEHRP